MTQHTIFCFNNGGSPGFEVAVAIGDDGQCVAQHMCSGEWYMQHDLGMTSDWKHEHYDEAYGKGNWTLEWVPTEQVKAKTHAGLQEAFRLNHLAGVAAGEVEDEDGA